MRYLSGLLLLAALLWVPLAPLAQEAEPAAEEAVAAEAAPRCGTQPLTIASMQWPSAQILAEIHARILAAQFDCDVRIVEGDLAATGSAMAASGQPAVAPEMWVSRIPEIWNPATNAQQVRRAGDTFAETALEGWFIPDYVAEANPEIINPATLLSAWQVFARGGPKGRFVSCPPDWGCAVINRNLLRAFGLDGLFEVVEPANRFELDTLIAEAVGRKEPILFYYWQPNAVLAQFSFKQLDLGAFDQTALACLGQRSCALPKPSSFPPEPVVIALAEWVFTEAPEVAVYFQQARMPVAEMNALLAALTEAGASVQVVAERFVADRGAVWRPWAGLPVEPEPAPEAAAAEPAAE